MSKYTSNHFQEGVLENAMKAAANIDVNKIKDTWKDADKDIVDKVKTTKEEGIDKVNGQLSKINNTLNNHLVNNASIIARARNSVLQFPVYITQGIRVNEAHILSKMYERVYATLVQTVLSNNQIIDADTANNLVFLKQFHTNLHESVDTALNKYYESIDSFDQMMCESIHHSAKLADNLFVEFNVIPTTDEHLIYENAHLCNEPLTGLSYIKEALDEDVKNVEKGNVRTTEKEPDTPERLVTDEELLGIARKIGIKANNNEERLNQIKERIRSHKGSIQIGKPPREILVRRNRNAKPDEDQYDYYLPELKGTKTVTTDSDKVTDKRFRDAVEAPKFLKDSDIKKINGMLPYTIEATFRLKTPQGLDRDVHYIIGIKTVLHDISVKDLSDELRDIITGDVKRLQKVRYKTGEISFKDYFFHIKSIKADAAKNINYDKRWLNTLKRLGEYNKLHGTVLKNGVKMLTGGDVPIPNGTFILSQPEVTELANKTGIDLSLVANVKRFAKALFLISFAIIDSTAGTMRVIFPDSDNSWDVQSLSSVDAEMSKTDNSQLMKELNRMVNR